MASQVESEVFAVPVVQVSLLKGRSEEQKRNLLRAITNAVVESVDAKPVSVRVIINEIEPSHWSVAGVPFSERDDH